MERVSEMVTVQGFRDANYWFGLNGADEPVGSASMTRLVVLRRLSPRSASIDASHIWSHTNNLANGGWYVTVTGSGNFNFGVSENGAAALTASSTYNLVTSYEEIFIVCCSYDGNNARILVNGIADAQAAVGGGYTVPIASRELCIGIQSQTLSLPCHQFGVVACLASDTTALNAAGLVAAEAQLRADMKHGRDLRAAGALANPVYYDARDAVINGQVWVAWLPRVGVGVTYTRVGTLQPASYQART